MFEHVHKLTIDAAAGKATGLARIGADLPALADHFPGHPILPGTWTVELAAQIAGPLVEEIAADGRVALLAMIRHARFDAPIELPAGFSIDATVTRREPSTITCDTIVYRGGLLLARAELVFTLYESSDREALAARAERLARWKATP